MSKNETKAFLSQTLVSLLVFWFLAPSLAGIMLKHPKLVQIMPIFQRCVIGQFGQTLQSRRRSEMDLDIETQESPRVDAGFNSDSNEV